MATSATMPDKQQVNMRLSAEARMTLERLQDYYNGISQAAVVEILLKDKGIELGLLKTPRSR